VEDFACDIRLARPKPLAEEIRRVFPRQTGVPGGFGAPRR
jgi:hypothetical protein